MKKRIFNCKSVIYRFILLNKLNYCGLIIFCLSICYYSFFSCGTSLTERNIYLCGTIQTTFGIRIKRSSRFWKKELSRFTFGIDKQKGNFNPNVNGG